VATHALDLSKVLIPHQLASYTNKQAEGAQLAKGAQQSVALSPDGKRVAMWVCSNKACTTGSDQDLGYCQTDIFGGVHLPRK